MLTDYQHYRNMEENRKLFPYLSTFPFTVKDRHEVLLRVFGKHQLSGGDTVAATYIFDYYMSFCDSKPSPSRRDLVEIASACKIIASQKTPEQKRQAVMMKKIVKKVVGNLPPSPMEFFTIYVDILGIKNTKAVVRLLSEAVLDYHVMISFRPSEIAASAIMLHVGVHREQFEQFTGYTPKMLGPCMRYLKSVIG